MRILLDECVPRKLGRELVGHPVRTVTQVGWAGIKNGSLLLSAARDFDVFITMDRRLSRDSQIPPSLAAVTMIAINNQVETQSNRDTIESRHYGPWCLVSSKCSNRFVRAKWWKSASSNAVESSVRGTAAGNSRHAFSTQWKVAASPTWFRRIEGQDPRRQARLARGDRRSW